MKKHLLFAAMLAMCAAPAVANLVTNQAVFAADEAPETLATEAEYNALVKAITDYQAELTALLAELDEKYPLDDTAHGSIKATLTGEGGLASMLEEVKAKYAAGTLTSKEVAAYQATIAQYKEGLPKDQLIDIAAGEQLQGETNAYRDEATDKIAAAEEKLPKNVSDYFSSVMDDYGSQIGTAASAVLLEEQLEKFKQTADSLVDKAIAYAASAETASQLVKDLKATLPNWTEQIKKGKVDFPDFDWDTQTENVAYWQKVLKNLSDYCDDPSTAYSATDFEDMGEEFGYYVDINLYDMAQNEEWGAEYNAKFMVVSQKISDATSTLDAECPNVAANYIPQLEDLVAEMTQASNKFNEGTVSKEEFDKMMARVDEISAEVDKILEKAKAEQLATGINSVTITEAVKTGKVYSIDGKRVNAAQKGVFIVNGKKVVLKK